MSVIVTDGGFGPETYAGVIVPLDAFDGIGGVDLPNDANVMAVFQSVRGADMIRIPFPSFADGRGFTLARRLRQLGYTGRLRAQGHVLSDQYPHARRCGFDEVEISDELATRQPEGHWSGVRHVSYQDRLTTAL
ncbi:MAG: DUF934 domain-containing protein [Pseudomonadota bacterium]